jgi:predicted 2-oxoglutarate/Fe(II)-dependent dioxygenase YbiX
MAEGTLADYRRNAVEPSEWVDGRAASSFWTGRLKNDERFEVTAFRCSQCGFLKLYAEKPSTSPQRFW